MRWVSVVQVSVVAAVTAGDVRAGFESAVEGQARGAGIPRLNGKPDLNGLWQAINSANWDIQAHTAKPALQMRPGPVVPIPAKEVLALGAVGSVPSGAGVVEGDELPYTAEGLKKKQDNQENWLTRDPEIKCYLPGVPRATYMPFPFQIIQSNAATFIAHEYAGAVRHIYPKDPGPAQIDSWMGMSLQHVGRRHVCRPHLGLQRSDVVRSRRQPSLGQAEGHRALHDDRRRSHQLRSDHRRSSDIHAALEDEHAALPSC